MFCFGLRFCLCMKVGDELVLLVCFSVTELVCAVLGGVRNGGILGVLYSLGGVFRIFEQQLL